MDDTTTSPDPTAIITRFLDDAGRVAAVTDAGGDWSAPSPCEGWSAADVVAHLVDTERDFLGRHAELADEPAYAGPAARWAAHLEVLRGVLTPALAQTSFDGYFGPTTVGAVLEEFYDLDLLVHRWDLATALGHDATLDDDELDRIERCIPAPGEAKYQAFYSPGICAEPLPVPAGATRQQRVLALLGRRT